MVTAPQMAGGIRDFRTRCGWVPVSKEIGNAVEGDAGGGGFKGSEHGGGGEGAGAVFVVQLVHGGEQTGAALGIVERIEEIEGVKAVGNEVVELHADEVGLVVFRARGAIGPEAAEGGNEGLVVLALA
jgi:hypothetical protein